MALLSRLTWGPCSLFRGIGLKCCGKISTFELPKCSNRVLRITATGLFKWKKEYKVQVFLCSPAARLQLPIDPKYVTITENTINSGKVSLFVFFLPFQVVKKLISPAFKLPSSPRIPMLIAGLRYMLWTARLYSCDRCIWRMTLIISLQLTLFELLEDPSLSPRLSSNYLRLVF
jgi:hypothetical protein